VVEITVVSEFAVALHVEFAWCALFPLVNVRTIALQLAIAFLKVPADCCLLHDAYISLSLIMKRKENSKGKYESALNSAALQDHLLKKGNYKIDLMPFEKQVFRSAIKPSSQGTVSTMSATRSKLTSELTLPSIKKQPPKTQSILPYETDEMKKLKELAS
jgi:hypothetical protein